MRAEEFKLKRKRVKRFELKAFLGLAPHIARGWASSTLGEARVDSKSRGCICDEVFSILAQRKYWARNRPINWLDRSYLLSDFSYLLFICTFPAEVLICPEGSRGSQNRFAHIFL